MPDDTRGGKLRDSLSLTRQEEKEELQDLNDRLSRYIEFIQKNQYDPALGADLEAVAESIRSKLDDLSKLYADELAAVRNNLDNIALRLAKSQTDHKSAVSARDEALGELEDAKRREGRLADEVASLKAQISRLRSELDNAKGMKSAQDDLKKQLDIAKQQLEKETLNRTDLENRLMTANEQLQFKDKVLSKEREAWNSEALRVQLEAVQKEADKYRVKLKEKLDELRDEMTKQMKMLNAKMEKSLEDKLNAEKNKVKDAEARADAEQKERKRLAASLSSHMTELRTCRSDLELAHRKIEQLNATIDDLRSKLLEAGEQNRDELDRLKDLLNAKSLECVQLASDKVQLNAEIAMYRSLLESEESRCKISPSRQNLTGKAIVRSSERQLTSSKKRPYIPLDRELHVDLDAIPKRTRVEQQYSHDSSTIAPTHHTREERMETDDVGAFHRYSSGGRSLRITCSSNGPVHFASADPGDGMVRIRNASDETVTLQDWYLHFGPTRPGNKEYVTLYVFPSSQRLKPHSEMKVFLCPTGGNQVDRLPTKRERRRESPSLYIVTEASIWQPYKSLLCLKDGSGNVRASCEIQPFDRTSIDSATKTSLPILSNITPTSFRSSTASATYRGGTGSRQSDGSFRITCAADDPVHFESVESGGGILLISNASNKVTDIGNWRLKFRSLNHEVNHTFSASEKLEPHSSIRVYLCAAGDKTARQNEPVLYVVTDAPVSEQYNSTFTLYDSAGTTRATCKIEPISAGDTVIPAIELTEGEEGEEESAEESEPETGSKHSVKEPEAVAVYIAPRRSELGSSKYTSTYSKYDYGRGGGTLDSAVSDRYRAFVIENPTDRPGIFSCPFM
ncbi:unnamed protein product [Calicophoron daubneyi]|uniref:LTD domain-containing protein n=1 Tax=Calicophoron daubneyi TaxID=300641 RepID=A0AAV2TLA3_CALDB